MNPVNSASLILPIVGKGYSTPLVLNLLPPPPAPIFKNYAVFPPPHPYLPPLHSYLPSDPPHPLPIYIAAPQLYQYRIRPRGSQHSLKKSLPYPIFT